MYKRTKEQQQRYGRTFRNKHREKILEEKKIYYKENKEKIKEYKHNYYRMNSLYAKSQRVNYYSLPENRAKKILIKAKATARDRGHEFSITLEDIKIPEFCPYLGVRLTHSLGSGQLPTNSSIDRIDNSKGYIPGNVQIISRLANTMKASSTVDEMLTFSFNVIKKHANKETLEKYIKEFKKYATN